MWGGQEAVGYHAVCPILAGTWRLIWLIKIPLLAWSGLPSLLRFFVNLCPFLCNTIAILDGFYCTNSPEASSVSPLWLYSCAKNLPRYPSHPLWAFLLEICMLNRLWPSLDQKQSALDICHQLWIGLTRIWPSLPPYICSNFWYRLSLDLARRRYP